MKPEHAERLRAVRGLRRVIAKGQTLDQVEATGPPLAPFARELLYGSVRRYYSLSATIEQHLQQPLLPKHPDLWALLIIGAYQLLHTRVPDHASLNTSVDLTRDLGKRWARGLVNAILRNVQRHGGAEHSDHPQWLQAQLNDQYGAQAAPLLRANLERAPMALRVNSARHSVATYAELLAARSIDCTPGHGADTLLLAQPQASADLPGFAAGAVSVQDAGAQLAADCWPNTDATPLRVLDACAAPGGKLHHLRARRPQDVYVAIDTSTERLAHTVAEAQRLQLDTQTAGAQYRLGDATASEWWDGTLFDRILLDAPCSGSGTLRRNPDIKLHLAAEQLPDHGAKQMSLLRNLWGMLRPGGQLLYCTCSLLREENDDVIAMFTHAEPEVTVMPLKLPTGAPTSHGWQLTPLDPTTDGFYYARLHKPVAPKHTV